MEATFYPTTIPQSSSCPRRHTPVHFSAKTAANQSTSYCLAYLRSTMRRSSLSPRARDVLLSESPCRCSHCRLTLGAVASATFHLRAERQRHGVIPHRSRCNLSRMTDGVIERWSHIVSLSTTHVTFQIIAIHSQCQRSIQDPRDPSDGQYTIVPVDRTSNTILAVIVYIKYIKISSIHWTRANRCQINVVVSCRHANSTSWPSFPLVSVHPGAQSR